MPRYRKKTEETENGIESEESENGSGTEGESDEESSEGSDHLNDDQYENLL